MSKYREDWSSHARALTRPIQAPVCMDTVPSGEALHGGLSREDYLKVFKYGYSPNDVLYVHRPLHGQPAHRRGPLCHCRPLQVSREHFEGSDGLAYLSGELFEVH